MSTLKDILLNEDNRANVVKDAAGLVSSEVSAKSGLSGMAIKTGYKTVTKIRPGIIDDVVDGLLDRFVERLEPFFADWDGGGRNGAFDSFLNAKKNTVANALLGVTDDRAKIVGNKVLKKAYSTLRPQGEKNVEAAIPGLGRLLNKYLG